MPAERTQVQAGRHDQEQEEPRLRRCPAGGRPGRGPPRLCPHARRARQARRHRRAACAAACRARGAARCRADRAGARHRAERHLAGDAGGRHPHSVLRQPSRGFRLHLLRGLGRPGAGARHRRLPVRPASARRQDRHPGGPPRRHHHAAARGGLSRGRGRAGQRGNRQFAHRLFPARRWVRRHAPAAGGGARHRRRPRRQRLHGAGRARRHAGGRSHRCRSSASTPRRKACRRSRPATCWPRPRSMP